MTEESAAFRRFRASTVLDYDAWKDGTPYDVAALDEITEAERGLIEADLCAKGHLDWRDIEALRCLGTPGALARMKQAGHDQTDGGGAAALAAEAEEDWSPKVETRFIAKLAAARHMQGAFDRLFRIAEAHPTPIVRDALFDLAIGGHEDVRYAYGAFLLYLNGHAGDWCGLSNAHRPHLLALQESGPAHAAAVRWLKTKLKPKRKQVRKAAS